MTKTPTAPGHARTLHRSLGILFGVAVGVGSMVGVGILRTPGIVLGHAGSPLWALAIWVAGAAYVLLCVNYMAELAAAVPRSGGVYSFAERTLGRNGGVIVGWSDFLNSVYAIALLAVALSEYIGALVPSLALGTSGVALLLIGGFTTISVIGLNVASGTQKITSLVKLAALWALILSCFIFAPASHPQVAITASATGKAMTILGMLAAFQLVLGAFNGWAAPAYFGGETRQPRDVVRALLFGALLVSATYIGVNAALLYIVPTDVLVASKLPAADAMEILTSSQGLKIGMAAFLITLVAVLSLPSTLHAVIMQTSRTLHAMSQDGIFLRWGAYVNPRGAPVNAALISGLIAAILAVTSSFEKLFATFTVFAILNNLILLIGVVRLRQTEPDLARPFRMWFYPWALVPIVLIDLAIFVGFALMNPVLSASGAAVALVLYLVYRFVWSKQPGGSAYRTGED